MSINPTGAPPWTRQTSHTDYGGHLDKRNYMGAACINAQTDVGAEDFVRICSDLASLARVAPMWVITYQCHDGQPGDGAVRAPTINVADGMTGVSVLPYEGDGPPNDFPSAARNGNGDVTFTFAASYSDDYGVAGAWVPVTAGGTLHGTTAGDPTCVISGSTVRVRAFDHAGAAIAGAQVTVEFG